MNIGISLTPRVTNASRSLRPSQPEPASTRALASMEMRGSVDARGGEARQQAAAAGPEHAAAGRLDQRPQLLVGGRHLVHLARVLDAGVRDRGERAQRRLALDLVEAGRLDIDGGAPQPGPALSSVTSEASPPGADICTGPTFSSMERRSMVSLRPLAEASSRSSSRSGSFISQCDEPAQQVGVGPAALVAARPQPSMIGEQQGHPPAALAVEHQQRPLVGPAHEHAAAGGRDLDLAEPAAPGSAPCPPSPAGRA